MAIGLIGTKLGMTRLYDGKGVMCPATVIHVGGNVVTQIKTNEKEGYAGVQLGYADQKESRLPRPVAGHLKKAGVSPKRVLREFRTEAGDLKPGDAVLASVFEVGQFVDVIGVSKGKGFAGVVKKHNAAGQPETHGSMTHRRCGAIGMRSTPGRIWKNASMPGHLGDERKTAQNLKVLQVRPEDGVIVVVGAVPGSRGATVLIRQAKKKKAAPAAKK